MQPPRLIPGDKVAIISPSQPPTTKHSYEDFDNARKNFERATGLLTVLSANALAEHYYSAGTVTQRLDDFHWAISNPEIKGVVFSVGGNTAIELVDKLDYGLIKKNPKIITGISDATVLLNAILSKTGLITYHGVEFTDFANETMTYEIDSMLRAWFEDGVGVIKPNPNWRDLDNLPTAYSGWETIRPGVVEGVIIGGNFSSFSQLFPTRYLPKLHGSILVVECYRYSKRDIHNALARLRFWGVFDDIGGLIIGYCLGSDEPNIKGNDRNIKDLVLEVTSGYDFPVIQIGEIGHNVENLILPIGAQAKLNASAKEFTII